MAYDKIYEQDVTSVDQDFRKNWFVEGTGYVRCNKIVDYYSLNDRAVAPTDWADRISGINMLHVSEIYLIGAEALLCQGFRVLQQGNQLSWLTFIESRPDTDQGDDIQ